MRLVKLLRWKSLKNSGILFREFSEDKFSKGVRLPGTEDKKNLLKVITDERDENEIIPRGLDAIIVGGGIIGWSIAYFLRQYSSVSVGVIERDLSMSRAATTLGIGAIRQQFSEPENIQMSLYGAEFLRNAREHLSILDLDPPDIQFHPHGFLTLSSEKGFEELKKCFEMQKYLGAKVELLKKEDIKAIWPWMNVDDIGGGIHGYENEGWFDSWQVLTALKKKACTLGAYLIHGEAVGCEFREVSIGGKKVVRPSNTIVRQPNGDLAPYTSAYTIIAAGPWSASVGQIYGIGSQNSRMGVLPIPVEPRLQHIFVVSARNSSMDIHDKPSIDCPFIVDYSGLNVRRDRLGGDFIVFNDIPTLSKANFNTNCIKSKKSIENEIIGESGFNVDYSVFEKVIKPQLARRIPAFAESPIIRSGWAAPLDYNYIDQNLIIGPHPQHHTLLMATGSSGHGIEHSLAIGRGIYEYMLYGTKYQTIDFTNLHFQRFYEKEFIFEKELF